MEGGKNGRFANPIIVRETVKKLMAYFGEDVEIIKYDRKTTLGPH